MNKDDDRSYDEFDRCYECRGYGDDFYVDKDGDLVWNCDSCIFFERGGCESDDYDIERDQSGAVYNASRDDRC